MATNSGNRGNAKIWFIGGGAVVALAVVMFFSNYPPEPTDAAGTVGAAQRYSSPQISKDDVTVAPDELTTWLQSDTFDRIVKDPQAREIFTNPAFSHLVLDARTRQVFLSEARLLFVNEGTAKFLATDAAKKIVYDAKLQTAIESEAVKELLLDARVQKSLLEGASKVLENPAVMAAVRQNPSAKLVFENGSLVQYLSEAAKVATNATKPNLTLAESQKLVTDATVGKKLTYATDLEAQKVVSEARAKFLVYEAASFLTTDAAQRLVTNTANLHYLQQAANNVAITQAVGNARFMHFLESQSALNYLAAEARKAQVGIVE